MTLTDTSPGFPPLAALFLTHFDDMKGQTVIYYSSIDDLPAGLIEHTSLPSGLHLVDSDLVFFSHGPDAHPGVGLFRAVSVEGVGRGRRMGTLGVVLADHTAEYLFTLRPQLEKLFDHLESEDSNPFLSENTKTVLDEVWKGCRAESLKRLDVLGRIRALAVARSIVEASHPIAYMPSLLSTLGPLLITVYKYAVAGKRIMIYSPPPLLPIGAFGYCIQAISIPPRAAQEAEVSTWLGNVGLMELDNVKARKGGWIATTADSIYRSHTGVYDLFIDFSSPSNLTKSPPLASDPTLFVPSSIPGQPIPKTYAFHDLVLYRSLTYLKHSPPTVTLSGKLGLAGGTWLFMFEFYERAWALCKGVCEYALGIAPVGYIRLESGEEDARLLDPTSLRGGPIEDAEDDDDEDNEEEYHGDLTSDAVGTEEDEAVRVGRLVLRQFHHNTYHLYHRLKHLRKGDAGPLTEQELRKLTNKTWAWRSVADTPEAKWWTDLARVWGLLIDDEIDYM